MNYFMLSLFGITMASVQPHEISGRMVDIETGEVILIFPELKNQKNLNLGALDVWGKEKNSETKYTSINGLESSSTFKIDGFTNQSRTDSISCSSNGSCDGAVSLEKSTSSN